MIVESFSAGLQPHWRVTQIGPAQVDPQPGRLRLTNLPVQNAYTDAQISDYPPYRWRPPLRLTVTAQAIPDAGQWRGTAGFGFWNQPFMPGQVNFRLPRALWFFFSSPPSDMRLAQDVPGPGWKAATLDAGRWQFLALLPTAPLGLLLMRVPALHNRLWPVGQRALGVSEKLLDRALLAERHTYTLDWQTDHAVFAVDGAVVHRTPTAPGGPLGFVAWIDNQYAVVTPQGHLRFGLLDLDTPQTLQIEYVSIE
jgi:hypothetical protein